MAGALATTMKNYTRFAMPAALVSAALVVFCIQVAPASGSHPPPQQGTIDTIVIIVKENRTYDALFGTFPGGDGKDAGGTVCQDRFDDDIPHGRAVALMAKDKHVRCKQSPENVPQYHALAKAYTLCDAFFS